MDGLATDATLPMCRCHSAIAWLALGANPKGHGMSHAAPANSELQSGEATSH